MNILSIDCGGMATGYFGRDTKTNKIFGEVIKNRNQFIKDKTVTEIRRQARSQRRSCSRKKDRNLKLLKLFMLLGWIDNFNVLEKWKERNPLHLRLKGLNEFLTIDELSQVIYNLAQRRGYYGDINELETERVLLTQEEQKNYIIDHISEIEKNKSTPIEYLNSLFKNRQRCKGRVFLHIQYEREFDKLWKKQKQFHKDLQYIDSVLWSNIIKNICHKNNSLKTKKLGLKFLIWDYIISYRKSSKSYRHLIKDCSIFPNKKTTLKCFEEFQEYRILDKIKNIKKIENDEKIALTTQEITLLYQLFNNNSVITITDVKKMLGCKQISEKGKMFGNVTRINMLSLFKDWDSFKQQKKDFIINLIYNEKGDKKCLKILELSLELEQTLKKVYLNLDKGSCNFSKKALSTIINPSLKEGKMLYDILLEFNANKNLKINSLPPSIKNKLSILDHVVKRHFINFNKNPDIVYLEVPKESNDPFVKNKIEIENKKREKINSNIKNILIDSNIEPISSNVMKYKLWEECNRICPYTGKSISFQELFVYKQFEVEHILTNFSNSFDNLTICDRDFNILKGNRTPYEMYKEGLIDKNQYDLILKRVLLFTSINGSKTNQKYKNFIDNITVSELRNNFDLFYNRFMADTSYTAKIYKQYLQQKYNFNVKTVKPAVTLQLRNKLNLNLLMNDGFNNTIKPYIDRNQVLFEHFNKINPKQKNRYDNRHHLADAISISFISDFNALVKENEKEDIKEILWKSWRLDLKDLLNHCIVYNKIKHRDIEKKKNNNYAIRGELHASILRSPKNYNLNGELNLDKILKIKQDIYNRPVLAQNSENIFCVVYEDGDKKMINLQNVLHSKLKKDKIIVETDDKKVREVFKKNNYYLLDSEEFRFSEMSLDEVNNLPDFIKFENLYRLFKITNGTGSFVHHTMSITDFKYKENDKNKTAILHKSNRNLSNIFGVKISLKFGFSAFKIIKS